MEYLQSFLIVVMETICFFLFQDAFISSKKRYKSGIYAIWILCVSCLVVILSYVFEDSFVIKESSMILLLFCATAILKREKKRALLAAVMFIFFAGNCRCHNSIAGYKSSCG